jgi:shikimate dehydrogenase
MSGSMQKMLVGLIGSAIQKSLSPVLHEDAFAAAGLRGHYHLMDLDLLQGELVDLLDAVRIAGFAGTNITYPCKESVLPLLDEISAYARQIGAVNTVIIDSSRRTVGHNTDRIGFRTGFTETLGREAIAGLDAIVVGAGGAGRAVAFALLDLGARCLFVHDRDARRSAALAADLICHWGAGRCEVLEEVGPAMAAVAGIVNATPIGMLGFPGIPVPTAGLRAHHWIADVIYTPLETALIKAARDKGARVLTGGAMCVHQAAEAFRLFTGIVPDVARMKRVFASAVADRDKAFSADGSPMLARGNS